MDRQTRHSLHHTLRCQSTWYACESRISRTALGGSGLDLRESSGLGVVRYSMQTGRTTTAEHVSMHPAFFACRQSHRASLWTRPAPGAVR